MRLSTIVVVFLLCGCAMTGKIAIAQVPVLNINQTARLSNGNQDPVYATVSFSKWLAFQETFVGLSRYEEAKKTGEDPNKYQKWMDKDKAQREKMIAEKQLFLIPYNTKVKILNYKEDKQAQEAALTYTGRSARYGTFEVEALEGEYKGRKLWTRDAVDALRPNVGDSAYIINISKPAEGVIVAFDVIRVKLYREAVANGDDRYLEMVKKIKSVFEVKPNTECVVVGSEVYLLDKILYFQVRITKGEYTDKLVWCPYVSLTPAQNTPK